jgi:hypothetical protein
MPGELDQNCSAHVCDHDGEKDSRRAMSIALTITTEIDQVAERKTIEAAV